MNPTSSFSFFDEIPQEQPGITTIDIPSNIDNKSKLLDIYAQKLPIKDYFGQNWDALEEVLRDFSWEDNKSIRIVHHDLPHLPKDETEIYLSILNSAINYWENEAPNNKKIKLHNFSVLFPKRVQPTIDTIDD